MESSLSPPQISSKAEILMLTTTDQIGGMAQIACTLSRGLRDGGRTVRTLFPQTENQYALRTWCAQQGVTVETHPAVLDIVAPHSRNDMRALRDLVRETRPDYVHFHYGESYLSLKDLIAARLAGSIRCICSIHGASPWAAFNPEKRRMTRLAALLSHRVVANSHATYDVIRQAGIPARKVSLIPCGVARPRRLPSRPEARTRLGLTPEAFVIATAARLVREKGIDELLKATARAGTGSDTMILIAGDGPERTSLEALAAQILPGRSLFLGRVSAMEDLYAAADIFVLPSHMESFGLVFIEAAYHGIPSIGTNVGGIPDAIIDGQTGLLVPAHDADALASAIRRLHADAALCRQMGDAARIRAEAEFDEPVMVERYARLLSKKKS